MPFPVDRRCRPGRSVIAAASSARVFLVLLIATGAIMFTAGSARAHVSLISSDPADGAVPVKAPTAVRLTFSEPVLQRFASVAVTDPRGRRMESAATTVDGAAVSVALSSPTTAGRYTVGWRVVSEDGHPIAGTVRFTLTGTAVAAAAARPSPAASTTARAAGVTPAASVTTLAHPPAAASGSAGSGNFVTDHAWHFVIGGVVVLVGAAVLWRERRMAR